MPIPYDPKRFEDVTPPTGQEIMQYAESKTPQLADESVNAIGGSFYPEKTLNPIGKLLGKAADYTGASKLPDWLMQKAVGMKKYIPGVGQELVDQGIMGPAALMKSQVKGKLGSTGQQIGQSVNEIPGNISHAPVAEELSQLKSQYTTPSGVTSSAMAPNLDKVTHRALEVAMRPDAPANELFGFKQLAQKEGYNKLGDPLAKVNSQLAQTEGSAYGKLLSDAYAKAHPENPEQLADLNKTYFSLNKANRALDSKSGIGLESILKKTLPVPTSASLGAHGINQLGRAIEQSPNRALQVDTDRSINSAPKQPMPYDPTRFEDVK